MEAKTYGLIAHLRPNVSRLASSGIWLSPDIKARILR
ncbi:hypothetical protein [uncultured Chloroflexus sp.]